MPEVSVVIPCYNHGHYIDEAVESILAQTFTDVEIIIINDGSTDQETIDKLQNYKRPHTTVLQTANKGPSAARNYGFERTSGKYVLTLDADDYFEPSYLEIATEVLKQHNQIGIVSCGIIYFGKKNARYMPEVTDATTILAGCPPTSGLIRRTCWEQAGGYDESMKRYGYEDWDFWLRITKQGWRIYVLQDYLFNYRWHEQSRRTDSHKRRIEGVRKILKNHHKVYSENVEHVFCAQEDKIIRIKEDNKSIRASLEYRTGKKLLSPFRFLQKIVVRKKCS